MMCSSEWSSNGDISPLVVQLPITTLHVRGSANPGRSAWFGALSCYVCTFGLFMRMKFHRPNCWLVPSSVQQTMNSIHCATRDSWMNQHICLEELMKNKIAIAHLWITDIRWFPPPQRSRIIRLFGTEMNITLNWRREIHNGFHWLAPASQTAYMFWIGAKITHRRTYTLTIGYSTSPPLLNSFTLWRRSIASGFSESRYPVIFYPIIELWSSDATAHKNLQSQYSNAGNKLCIMT